MDVRFAFICDAAQELAGKIAALGIGIDTIYAADINQPVRPFTFVINIWGSVTEAGIKRISVRMIDADGNDVAQPINGQVNIGRPKSGHRTGAGLVIEYHNVKFPSYGAYTISFLLDGNELTSLPLTIAPPPTTR